MEDKKSSLLKMADKLKQWDSDVEKDRRSFDRLVFNNGTASIFKNFWYYNLKYNLLGNFTSFMPEKSAIHNLSSSGSCVHSKTSFKRGDAIRLIITVPDVKNILIKGTVRWITESDLPNTGNIGIQFLAFSNWTKYNSFSTLKQLQVVILLKNQLATDEYYKDKNSYLYEQLSLQK